MISGTVTATYTGIGGVNLDSGIMPADITGSSSQAEGATLRDISITWNLPGGITNIKYRSGFQGTEWGYLFQGQQCTDEIVMQKIKEELPGVDFDAQGNLVNPADEARVRNLVNNWAYAYLGRALHETGGSDWTEFKNYFGDGVCVHINI